MRQKDYTNAVIICFVVAVLMGVSFAVTMEVLKFAALIKWVFS